MRRENLAWVLLVVAIIYITAFYFLGSALKPGYSQWSNFISEYNATGTPWAKFLTFAGFGMSTVLLSAFWLVALPVMQVSGVSRVGFWLLWALPASYLIGTLFPCDIGCPVEGSLNQILHNLLAVPVYFLMGLSLVLIALAPRFSAYRLRRVFLMGVGVAFPVVFIAMLAPELVAWRGIIQRFLDVGMGMSLLLMCQTLMLPTRQERDV